MGRPDRGARGGVPDGRTLKAVIPGGASSPILGPEALDIAVRARGARGRGHDGGVGGRDGDRRRDLHRAARAAHGRRSTATRAAASARRAARARAGSSTLLQRIEDGIARARRDRPACSRSATTSRASACARSATPARCPCARWSSASARSSTRTSSRAACPLARHVARSSALYPAAAQSPAAADGAPDGATDVATVTLEIDGRELTVPKGTPLVVAAAPGRASRSRCSATSRGSARRSAPAACASSRSRACRSCRPPAR